ncbi:dihydrofolate reductase family protein [Arthrobacter sp. E3]|uniref:dihydrofolate reductase family protein n=1 Tax=Arthrobacter sp. E3 TaxID=517402 RepID=UPI001A94B55F|nr:dihydrofolate reductase family protein [Arthrobacter sp. E3]
MGQLVYSAITSLDGYIEDREGGFTWGMPDDDVHSFINNLERSIGTYLYGRKLYEVMKSWEPLFGQPDLIRVERDFAAIWHMSEKVVFSRTLEEVSTARTRIERTFDPEAIRAMKASAEDDLSVGGAELAGTAFKAGLVDQIHLFISPILIGGGKPALPDAAATRLELLDQHGFGNGIVHLHYRVKN